jgi:2-dehydro-3-deoxygalactonokinase
MIAIDWGSTSLRAFRLDSEGRVLEQRRSARGVLAAEGRFAEVLREEIAGWDDALIVMAGMIGSRQGWFEVPYVDCPAGLDDIAAALHRVRADEFKGREIWIVPGLCTRDDGGAYDVMRGEETQICGVLTELDAQRQTVCLPGTHSKRATVADGRIEGFATTMTGELFELLCAHSVLGRLMQPGEHDAGAFAHGVAHAAHAGDLLHHLFAVRTLGLFDALRPTQLRPFLSGLLIGHELNDMPTDAGAVHLIGAPVLLAAYETALGLRGHAVSAHSELASAKGCYALVNRAGLLPEERVDHGLRG